jgi:membrane associated rhomboid family serine protease
MILPLNHEDLRGRRYPVVTIAIIVMCAVAFLGTTWKLDEESEALATVKIHIFILAANFPDVQMTPEIQQMVESFRESQPKMWERMKSKNREIFDAWDARTRMTDELDYNAEMAALTDEYNKIASDSILEGYAFVPAKASIKTAITSAFLHGGWLHIIFNMWFLWLAGTVLEDKWGRPVYALFYVLAAIASCYGYVMLEPNSMGMGIGASGAVAGCMGAFLVRYFKTKIDFVLVYFLGFVPRFYKFKSPAWLMLPLWAGTELFYGLMFGHATGVGHWVHVSGFIFGVVFALGMKFSGIEQKMDQAIEKQVSWQADPSLTEATQLMEQNRVDEAIALLQQTVQQKPELIEAHDMLAQLYWRKQDMEGHKKSLAMLCKLHLKKKDVAAAVQNYDDLVGVGGDKIDAGDWTQLCRYFEGQQNWERAAVEYEKYAHAYPNDKLAVYSLVAAARIWLKKLERRDEAARLYREAQKSPVPHMDWDDAIKRGLAEATSGSPAMA